MADTSRIEELRRRVQRDPASIAFAQLAEEYRRAGRYKEAIATCEDGLMHHPGYLSARVTLGRALIETDQLDAAQLELRQVLRAAPENLAALRGLAEIHHRRGELHEALAHYRTALEFARHDPELEHLVEQIQLELEPRSSAPVVVDGLSFDEVKDAFLNLSLPAEEGEAAAEEEPLPAAPEHLAPVEDPPVARDQPLAEDAVAEDGGAPHEFGVAQVPETVPAAEPALVEEPVQVVAPVQDTARLLQPDSTDEGAEREEELDVPAPVVSAVAADPLAMEAAAPVAAAAGSGPQVDALERWLEVILAERQRRA